MTLQTQGLQSLEQVQAFFVGAVSVEFEAHDRSAEDITNLSNMDRLLGVLSGLATRNLCERARSA
ncbi:MAG: hypothetical protein HQ478_12210 [Chloroflexi bacterium]|nr:hypothetical protein [Chloroflexota bacterium]